MDNILPCSRAGANVSGAKLDSLIYITFAGVYLHFERVDSKKVCLFQVTSVHVKKKGLVI